MIIPACMVILSSCEKNDVDESATAQLKIVNGSPTSEKQEFYLVNNLLGSTDFAYGEFSDYITAKLG